VQWATLELEVDKLRLEMGSHLRREEELEAQKFEESLKVSILEKRSEIDRKIKQRHDQKKHLGPKIKKLGRLFSNPLKRDHKEMRSVGENPIGPDTGRSGVESSQRSNPIQNTGSN